jgi:Cu(I)/Ag(I) efflux system membrane protein CusA/SilA
MPAPSAPTGGGGGGMSMGGGVSAPAAAPMPASTGGGGTTIQLPLGQLARITTTPGPAMINSENGQLRALVQLNARGRDMGSFVDEAKAALERDLKLPAGYSLQWSGQYENQIHARKRLQVLIPLVLLIIFAILYFTLHSATEAGLVMLSVPFALIGGVYLMWFYGFNWSVAVWVGFIALYGVAVQTGVVMVVYLHHALARRIALKTGGVVDDAGLPHEGSSVVLPDTALLHVTHEEIREAAVEGAVGRLRPKLMTVTTAMFGLVPILFSAGVGADVMKPLVAPMIGGLFSSAVHVLIMTPVLFVMMTERARRNAQFKIQKSKRGSAELGAGRDSE